MMFSMREEKSQDVLSNRLFRVQLLQDVRVAPSALNLLAILFFLSKFAVGRAHLVACGVPSEQREEDDDEQDEEH